jgi:hypothetical protein
MLSSYQVVLWKQESFGVLHPLQIEFFRNLLGCKPADSTPAALDLSGTDDKTAASSSPPACPP